MATEDKVMSQAEIDALVAKVPPKPAAPPASAPEPAPEPAPVSKPVSKPVAAPPTASPVENRPMKYQKYASHEVEQLQNTVADLARQVGKFTNTLQRIEQLEEKMKQAAALLKLTPASTDTLESRIDEVSRRLEEIKHLGSNIQSEFECRHCKSKQTVAVHVKCTNCGEENWMGWWADSGQTPKAP